MLRSDWRFILAVVVGLGVLITLYGYYEVEQTTRPQNTENDYRPAYRASLPVRRVAGQPKAKEYDPHCKQPDNQGDADLCAQWSAVEATNESNRLVRYGILLSFLLGGLGIVATAVGTVLIYRSLRQSDDALEQARTAVATENRAWMVQIRLGSGPQVDNAGNVTQVGITADWKNVGNTPALEVDTQSLIYVISPNIALNELILPNKPETTNIGKSVVGQEDSVYCLRGINKPTWDSARQGYSIILFRTWLTYRDVFSDEVRNSETVHAVTPLVDWATATNLSVSGKVDLVSWKTATQHQVAT